jgi:hypothetical protein
VFPTAGRRDVKRVQTAAGAFGTSDAMRRYMDGKISSSDYLREVRKEAAREVDRELKKPAKKEG